MKIGLVAASAIMLAAAASTAPAQQSAPRVYTPQESNVPQIDLWLDQISYRPGDRLAPHFVTDRGAYVTIVRVTSDGQLAVLYPRRPREQVPYEMGQLVNDRVPHYFSFDNRFEVASSRGIGFVFAIASFEKFNYSYYTTGSEWSEARLANDSRYGDPFETVQRFADRTLGSGNFSLDYVSYDVQRDGPRSRYASRYTYNSYDDFYDACVSAFGLRYTTYCYNAYPGYFGPIIVTQPTSPTPGQFNGRNLLGKTIKPVVGDPVVGGAPTGPQPATEGRLPSSDPSEAAALASQRARMLRDAAPRDRAPTQVEIPVYRGIPETSSPQRADPAPRTEPMSHPVMIEPPVMRAEPRVEQPRFEPPRAEPPHVQPPPQPVAQPRVEVRNDPPPAPAPAPVQQAAPRPTATPAEKDHQN
jgi:hypothetical protein